MRAVGVMLVLCLLLVSCAVTPQKVANLVSDPATSAVTGGGDAALSVLAPPLAHLTEAAEAVKDAASQIAEARKAHPEGPAPGDPLTAQDWITIALGGMTGLLGLHTVRNQKYIPKGGSPA